MLEKAPEFGEIGYGIQQGPNAYLMLDWLGVMKALEPQAVFTKNMILIDALTDKELTRISCCPAFHRRYCGPLANSLFHHRPEAKFQPDSKLEAAAHKEIFLPFIPFQNINNKLSFAQSFAI